MMPPAGLIGRTTALVGFRGSCPRICAAFEGIAGTGVLDLPKDGIFIPNSFFLGLLIGSRRSGFFSALATRHSSRRSCLKIMISSLGVESALISSSACKCHLAFALTHHRRWRHLACHLKQVDLAASLDLGSRRPLIFVQCFELGLRGSGTVLAALRMSRTCCRPGDRGSLI